MDLGVNFTPPNNYGLSQELRGKGNGKKSDFSVSRVWVYLSQDSQVDLNQQKSEAVIL